MSATPSTVIAQLVDTMRALAGPRPGFRPVHAKGIVCSGTFRAAPQARAVTRAAHLQVQTVPTVIRFSNSSGDPDVHDGVPNARAMASSRSVEPDMANLTVAGRAAAAAANLKVHVQILLRFI
jgi:catalase